VTLNTLYTTVDTALKTITAVKEVSTDITRFNGAKNYPVLYFEINNSGTEWVSFPSTANTDKEATAELTVHGTVNPRYSKNIQADTLSLIASVETAINGILTTTDVVNVALTSQRNDIDVNNTFGYFQATFEVVYLYNRLSP
jgi:hypothetical protein